MNEERIQQVISIEKEAFQIHENAVRDSQQLLMLANQEVDTIIGKAQKEAALEAQKLVADVPVNEESARILKEAEEKNARAIDLSRGNFELAVRYILDRAIGKE